MNNTYGIKSVPNDGTTTIPSDVSDLKSFSYAQYNSVLSYELFLLYAKWLS